MIRKFELIDLDNVMQIWLNTNIEAHDFIPECYWKNNFDLVKELMPSAELYVYENEASHRIEGFIGLMDNYIAGIFVLRDVQSQGIGTELLQYVKRIRQCLKLHVYQKNTRAINFYKREQFEILSEEKNGDTGEIEYLMIWSHT